MILAAAAQAIGRNKMRSALTMLGVFIGVAALIAMVAVGDGANEAVRKQIESLGTNLVVVQPGAVTAGGVRGGRRQRQHADGGRRPGDPARGFRGRRSGLPDPAAGAGPVRQPELDDQHPGRQRQLPADHQLAHCRRTGHHDEDDRQRPLWSSSSARPSITSSSRRTRIRSAPTSRSGTCRCR